MERDFEGYSLMPDEDFERLFHIAILLELPQLPQLKGAGKAKSPQVREEGIKTMTRAVIRRIRLARIVILQPPRERGPSMAGEYSSPEPANDVTAQSDQT